MAPLAATPPTILSDGGCEVEVPADGGSRQHDPVRIDQGRVAACRDACRAEVVRCVGETHVAGSGQCEDPGSRRDRRRGGKIGARALQRHAGADGSGIVVALAAARAHEAGVDLRRPRGAGGEEGERRGAADRAVQAEAAQPARGESESAIDRTGQAQRRSGIRRDHGVGGKRDRPGERRDAVGSDRARAEKTRTVEYHRLGADRHAVHDESRVAADMGCTSGGAQPVAARNLQRACAHLREPRVGVVARHDQRARAGLVETASAAHDAAERESSGGAGDRIAAS